MTPVKHIPYEGLNISKNLDIYKHKSNDKLISELIQTRNLIQCSKYSTKKTHYIKQQNIVKQQSWQHQNLNNRHNQIIIDIII